MHWPPVKRVVFLVGWPFFAHIGTLECQIVVVGSYCHTFLSKRENICNTYRNLNHFSPLSKQPNTLINQKKGWKHCKKIT
jgi:hypothetical protein